jgi:hypothetical protein
MINDLELLPVWYGGEGSFTLVRNIKSSQFVSSFPKEIRSNLSSPMILSLMMKEIFRRKRLGEKPKLPNLTAFPWGLSPRSISTFNELKLGGLDIDIPEWDEEYIVLTRRQTAAECLTKLQEIFPFTPPITIPVFVTDVEGIEYYISKNAPPFVIKTPLSSSGRGLHWISSDKLEARDISWINNTLRKQESISIEPAYSKVFDFASEFYSDGKGDVKYLGLSVFETRSQGQFIGCMLGTQEQLLKKLNEYMSTEDYLFVVEQIRLVLAEKVGSKYTGYMGVDMMIYKSVDGDYAVHPFVELNMRYTMGLVAMQISRQFIHPGSQGLFRINYYVYDTMSEHQRMLDSSPLFVENGKICSGYLSLCPVIQDTHYIAMLDVYESY